MTAQTVPGPRPSAVLAARYARALDIAVVVAAAGWQLAGAGTGETHGWLSEGTPGTPAWPAHGTATAAREPG